MKDMMYLVLAAALAAEAFDALLYAAEGEAVTRSQLHFLIHAITTGTMAGFALAVFL